MRSRKTINVDYVRTKVNTFLKMSPDDQHKEREALAGFIETILLEAGRYQGFNYVEWLDGGSDAWRAAGEPDFPKKYKFFGDQTRRYYF